MHDIGSDFFTRMLQDPNVNPFLEPPVNLKVQKESPRKLTGGSSDYYKTQIDTPTTKGKDPYEAECNDIIEALDMRFSEANVFKAIWRRAAARLGNGKPGTTDLYDAEKIKFFGDRILVVATHNSKGVKE
jgi:hypothetical protein